jgi:hypothetical protein
MDWRVIQIRRSTITNHLLMQSGTSHYFGDNFTKAFDIKFQNNNQKEEYGYTTS